MASLMTIFGICTTPDLGMAFPVLEGDRNGVWVECARKLPSQAPHFLFHIPMPCPGISERFLPNHPFICSPKPCEVCQAGMVMLTCQM